MVDWFGPTAATSSDTPNDRQFCINGLVFPDRSAHPTLLEAKRCQQPFTARLSMRGGVSVWITSEHAFRPTDNEHLYWQHMNEAGVLARGDYALALKPEEQKLTLLGDEELSGVTSWLNLWIEQPRATAWSGANHEVARWQFELGVRPKPSPYQRRVPRLRTHRRVLRWLQVIITG